MSKLDLKDGIAVVSASAVGYGLWLVHPAACWLFGGLVGLYVWRQTVNRGRNTNGRA